MKPNYNSLALWPSLGRVIEIALTGNFKIKLTGDYECWQRDADYVKQVNPDMFSETNHKMTYELYEPDCFANHGKYETMDDIMKRVNEAKKRKVPDYKLTVASMDLLKTAKVRLNLSILDLIEIENITCTIAQLENDSVQIQHLAEAIQYSKRMVESAI